MISYVCQYKVVWLKFTPNTLELNRRQQGRPNACFIAHQYSSATPSHCAFVPGQGHLGVLVKNNLICFQKKFAILKLRIFNPLNPDLNPICYLLALLGAHHFLHVSRIRVKLLTFRLLMSYIYGAPILDVSRSRTTTQHSR